VIARSCIAAVLLALLTGCGGGSSTPAATSTLPPTAPNLHDFLELPVASPRVCPSGQPAATVGRVSPWTGHVDISVFLEPTAPASDVNALGTLLRSQPLVLKVYVETQREAYEEFARLYTCSAAVPQSQTPASYRVVLKPGSTTQERNGLVARVVREPGVDSVSCDPSNPCVDVVRSAEPTG
jgi:hypothetical protein